MYVEASRWGLWQLPVLQAKTKMRTRQPLMDGETRVVGHAMRAWRYHGEYNTVRASRMRKRTLCRFALSVLRMCATIRGYLVTLMRCPPALASLSQTIEVWV